jgi:hypothetical protein
MKLIKVVFLKFSSVAKQVVKMKTHFYRCCIEKQMLSHLVDLWLAACPFIKPPLYIIGCRRQRVCAKFYRPISIQSAKRIINDVFAITFSSLQNDYFWKDIGHSGFVSGGGGGGGWLVWRRGPILLLRKKRKCFVVVFHFCENRNFSDDTSIYTVPRKSYKHFHFRKHLRLFLIFSQASFRENPKTNISFQPFYSFYASTSDKATERTLCECKGLKQGLDNLAIGLCLNRIGFFKQLLKLYCFQHVFKPSGQISSA